jgi:hypothetical protein
MNYNYAIQNSGIVAWSGTVGTPVDLRKHVGFAFTFEVTADIVTEAVFHVESAPASEADVCLPGTFVPVAEVLTCVALWGTVPAPNATIVIPAGTKKGQICSGTLPCKPDAFIRLAAGGGDTANVRAVVILHGPK